MDLGLTQPLTEMSTRNISWGEGGKGGRCVGLTTLLPSGADRHEIWEPQLPGTLRASPGHAVAQLVEALRCKLEGHGFDSRWFHWNFSLA